MAAVRKRLSSASSSLSEEEVGGQYYTTLPSVSSLPTEEHPYMDMFCCHRVQDSLLSSDSRFTNYRGILNWIIILLVLTHAHLFLENFIQYGFLIDLKKILKHLTEDNYNWPSVNLLLAANLFALVALLLEKSLEKGTLSHTTGHCLHLVNLGLLFILPTVVILYDPTISTGGAFCSLWTYIVLGLKLYSYQETNSWLRLDRSTDVTHTETDKPVSQEADVHHDRLDLKDLYYFLLAPTLCYQQSFPHTPRVRINTLLHRLLEMVVLAQIMVGIVQQWIEPIFQRSEHSFSNMDITMRLELLVGLVAPTQFLWLLLFFLSHSFLNFCAEVLCFGDRHFYGDWWNATTLIAFWRTWNIPLEKWSCRHLYTPLVEKNMSPPHAELLVFLMSAVLCEFAIALPLHSCRLWIFLMMLFELLLSAFFGRYFQGNYGNGLVWLCLLLGPPLAVTTYFHDHYISLHHHHHHHHHHHTPLSTSVQETTSPPS